MRVSTVPHSSNRGAVTTLKPEEKWGRTGFWNQKDESCETGPLSDDL